MESGKERATLSTDIERGKKKPAITIKKPIIQSGQ